MDLSAERLELRTARIAYSTNVLDAPSPRAMEMCEDQELVSSVVVLWVGG
jgi:hypothetical protein